MRARTARERSSGRVPPAPAEERRPVRLRCIGPSTPPPTLLPRAPLCVAALGRYGCLGRRLELCARFSKAWSPRGRVLRRSLAVLCAAHGGPRAAARAALQQPVRLRKSARLAGRGRGPARDCAEPLPARAHAHRSQGTSTPAQPRGAHADAPPLARRCRTTPPSRSHYT